MSTTSPRGKKEHLTALTSLRFFAALLVLLFHATTEIKVLPWGLSGFLRNGGMGVSLFFILSGFVLTYTYLGSTASLREFFVARFARIYPVYLFSLLVAAPFFFKKFVDDGHAGDVPSLIFGKLTMLQSWIPWMTDNWNVPSWSLSTEAFFYLLFPALLTALSKLPRSMRMPLMLAFAVFYGFGLPLSQFASPDYSLSPIRDAGLFACGILLGLEFDEGRRAPRWLFPAMVAGVVLFMIGFEPLPANGFVKTLFTLLLAGTIFGAASISPRTPHFLNDARLKLLGEASFALYILHVPIASIFGFAGSKLGFRLEQPFVMATYFAVCIWASIIVFRKIETPANRFLRRLGRSRKELAPASV